MRAAFLTIGAALLFSAAAMAGETQPATSTQQASNTDSNAMTCHFAAHEGVVLPRAVQCHTQHWWDRERRREQQEITDMQVHSLVTPM